MSFQPELNSRVTRGSNRLLRGRGRSRNVDNLHVIKTNVPAPVTNPPDYIRTVTITPKKNIGTPDPLEVKNMVIHKTPVATKVSAGQKDATISFTKKKINAAKSFLQQYNKESPVKKSINSKLNITDDCPVPTFSKSNLSPNLINDSSVPDLSINNTKSGSSNGSLASNSSNNQKSRKSKSVYISDHSHSCLALYELDMSLKPKNNKMQQTPWKAKRELAVQAKKDIAAPTKEDIAFPGKKDIAPPANKDIAARKEVSNSSWVPIDMKKSNKAKDSFIDNKKISVKSKHFVSSKHVEEKQKKPIFTKSIPKEKKRVMKEIPSKIFVDSKGERTVVRRSSNSSRYFSSRQEEERYYEKKYSLSRSSKMRRSQEYEREYKQYYQESYTNDFSPKSCDTRKSFYDESEALEDVSDVPLDEDFEEVETASLEDQNKASEIPVGFHKYKIRYLALKRIGYFKPKKYHICQERTVVSCLNMEEEESVDVVSEAEYDLDHNAVQKNFEEIKDVNLNTDDHEADFTSEIIENKALQTTDQLLEMDSAACNLTLTGDKFDEKCKPCNVPDSTEEALAPTDVLNNSASEDTDLVNVAVIKPCIKEKQEFISNSKLYYSCISESNSPAFYQGYSAIQKYLDEWQSHLIGLEYVVEIRDVLDKTKSKEYHCGLCKEKLAGVNTDGKIVIDHVTNYKHASAYMALTFEIS